MGVMSEVLNTLASSRVNVSDFNGKTLSQGYAIINAVVDVSGVTQLESVLNKLRTIKGVVSVNRHTE